MYSDDLIFGYIGENVYVKWNPQIISNFTEMWGYDLPRNRSIIWNEQLIMQFEDAEWFDWHDILFNRKVVLSKTFYNDRKSEIPKGYVVTDTSYRDSVVLYREWIVKRPKQYLFSSYINQQGGWQGTYSIPAELKHLAQDSIHHIPPDSLVKYAEFVNWGMYSECEECTWSLPIIEKLFPFVNQYDLASNPTVYNSLFEGIIDDEFIRSVFEKLYPSDMMRYYFLKEGRDNYGIVPSVRFKSRPNESLGEYLGSVLTFPESIPTDDYILSGLYEPPLRFVDYHDFFNRIHRHVLKEMVISERFKAILEQCNLPPHRFYPISMEISDHLYGADTMSYYLLLMDRSPLKDILKDSLHLVRRKSLFREPVNANDPTYHTFFRNKDYIEYLDSLRRTSDYRPVAVPELYLDASYDLICLGWREIYVSAQLKSLLERAQITGVQFYTIEPESPVIRARNNWELMADIQGYLANPLEHQVTIRNYEAARAKRDSILNKESSVDKIYAGVTGSIYPADSTRLIQRDSLVRSIELKWDVMFPAKYRNALIHRKLPNLGRAFREYELLDIDRIERLSSDWYMHHPLLVKGIVIASNGIGDHLALILKPDSTFQLEGIIYKLEHEMGEVIPSINLEEMIAE